MGCAAMAVPAMGPAHAVLDSPAPIAASSALSRSKLPVGGGSVMPQLRNVSAPRLLLSSSPLQVHAPCVPAGIGVLCAVRRAPVSMAPATQRQDRASAPTVTGGKPVRVHARVVREALAAAMERADKIPANAIASRDGVEEAGGIL